MADANTGDRDLEMMKYRENEVGPVDDSETENLRGGAPTKSRFSAAMTAYTVGNLTILIVLVIGVIVLISVTSATYDKVDNFKQSSTVTTVYESLGLPDYEGLSWEDATVKSEGSQVNFYMWSGDDKINAWVDDWLAGQVKDEYDITVTRVAVNDTGDAVTLILNEIADGNTTTGKVDLVWINGENYNALKSANALYGPFANKVPSASNFDFESAAIKYDFGRTTNGYEMPYNGAQVVFIYDSAHFPGASYPKNMDELLSWAAANPGRFTYPAPCTTSDCVTYDYTGSAFIRHFLYYYPTTSNYQNMVGDFNEATYTSHATPAFAKLKELDPYIYRNGGSSAYYPVSIDVSDELFGSGEIWLTLSYEPAHAGQMVASGAWPNSTLAYVPTSGSIANTNFVAIANNAKNRIGAVVVANYIGAIWSQFQRRQANVWGALQCYNPSAPALTTEGWQVAFDYLQTDAQTPSSADLRAGAMPEMVADYTTTFQSDWWQCLLNGSTNSPCV